MFDDAVTQLEPGSEPIDSERSILIIDDDRDQAEVLSYRLQKQGYRTCAATSGREGIQLAQCNTPQLVLLDLRLPDIDGFDVCRHLADSPETCMIPVIILSGMERPDIIRCTRYVGSQYYVRKPYDPNVLLILIQNALAEPW